MVTPTDLSQVRALALDHDHRHEDGGDDEISIESLDGEPNTVKDAKILLWLDL